MIIQSWPWLRRNRLNVAIFILAIAVRLFFVLSAPADKVATYAIGADGADYVHEAVNLSQGHGFSRSYAEPFQPDMIRTPIYPLFLSGVYKIFGDFHAVLFVELIISSIIPLMGMALLRRFITNRYLVAASGVILAIEPHMVFYTIFFVSESVFVPLFTLFLVTFVRWAQNNSTRDVIISGIALGLATLTRPITILLPALCVIFAVYLYWKSKNKSVIKKGILFLLVFILTLSPWMIRNKVHFGTFSISTVGWFNVYTRFATDIMATVNKTDFYTSYHQSLDKLALDGYIQHPAPVSEFEIQSSSFTPVLKKASFDIMTSHPKEFLKISTLATIAVITHDNTLNILETNWNLVTARPPFSPTLYFAQHGAAETLKALAPYIKGTYFIPYVGRFIWVIFFLVSLAGLWVAWRRNSSLAPLATFLFLVCAYFVIFTLNASPQIDARYRTQFFLCELVLFMIACDYIWTRFTKRNQ